MATFGTCLELAEAQLALRALRYGHFPNDIFDEHAWDMMLHLYVARLRDETIGSGHLIGMTTGNEAVGHRWIDHLRGKGIVVVDGDTVRLSDATFEAMDAYHRQALAALG